MKALVYDIDTEGWLQFERLIDLLLANSLSEVVAVFKQVDDRSRHGWYLSATFAGDGQGD